MSSKTVVAVSALIALTGLCIALTALGQTTAAVIALISSIGLCVQQILAAYHPSSRQPPPPAPTEQEPER